MHRGTPLPTIAGSRNKRRAGQRAPTRTAVSRGQGNCHAGGRLTVSVPRRLHVALKREAAGEGVSLSELIRLKLSWPYRQVTSQMLGGG